MDVLRRINRGRSSDGEALDEWKEEAEGTPSPWRATKAPDGYKSPKLATGGAISGERDSGDGRGAGHALPHDQTHSQHHHSFSLSSFFRSGRHGERGKKPANRERKSCMGRALGPNRTSADQSPRPTTDTGSGSSGGSPVDGHRDWKSVASPEPPPPPPPLSAGAMARRRQQAELWEGAEDRSDESNAEFFKALGEEAREKSSETTKAIVQAKQIAERTRGIGGDLLIALNEQGEMIARTHQTGEKVMRKMGPWFGKSWKPRRGKGVSGPPVVRVKSMKRMNSGKLRPELLGEPRKPQKPTVQELEKQTTLNHLEAERKEQDRGLDDLSDFLKDLKGLSLEIGDELSRQNPALDALHDDLTAVDKGVGHANTRLRYLVRR
ncbi:hypothetical protein CBR_g23064 [Chara braunii]|uniref:t-SNARE coiled-coil homology domain-containing protein n=1 Tax=Chara braunii TaxID=69332 RepID=A0A388L3F7_CHABU|nr:hypothetical protein CBR_g23064 [Chara braunii]|eukprot:GBG76849.1 hypothetical protein CBR_g23064 [Chara braunii]